MSQSDPAVGIAAPILRTASLRDLPAVKRLLAEAGLPVDDLDAVFAQNADTFVVAEVPDVAHAIVAVGR